MAAGEGTLERTFVIADVRGYTAFTHQHGDAAAGRLAQRFAELAREAVEARGGEVIELRGDEALAVFTSPIQAVTASLEFQNTCAEEVAADPSLPLLIGIGIASGEAVPIEGGYRGAALNLAARLCSTAAAGEVLTAASTAARLDGEVSLHPRGTASLKGFGEAMEIFEVDVPTAPAVTLPASPIGEPLPIELEPLTPLIGREHEMRWLRGTWRQARRGRGRVVFVSGPSSIGKTRLAAELATQLHDDGASVRYVGPGGTAMAMTATSLRAITSNSKPALLILDDFDLTGTAAVSALSDATGTLESRPALVVALMQDPDAAPGLAALLERADVRGDAHRRLRPLDLEGVEGIARAYLGDDVRDAPLESMARSSAGIPGRIHEVVSDWAREEATRRLAAAGEWVAARREQRSLDLGFTNNIIGLRLARLYGEGGYDAPAEDVPPYKGLASFAEDDAGSFFGREGLIGDIAARTVQVGLLGVVGASGSGKSSVVAAGVLPSLKAGLLPGSERWRQIVLRPGDHPTAALEGAMRPVLGAAGHDLAAAAAATPAEERLVVVVDQFEEVFTICSDDDERARFIDALCSAATSSPASIVVLPIIRGDFYGHCARYRDLAELLEQNHVLVGPMSENELRRAIELPARRARLRVESSLVQELIDEVGGEPGGLPLLSTALVELWQQRESGWLRAESYRATGGVRGAVARLADKSFEQLSPAERELARSIFLRLVGPGEGEAVSRRRVALSEFDVDDDPAAAQVLAVLTRDRLLTRDETTVEVAHEALLREWPRFQEWLQEDAEGRQLRLHLTQAAQSWATSDRDPSELYRGARLTATLDWAATRDRELNALEREFLLASRQNSELEADRQRRTNRRLRLLLGGVGLMLVAALAAGVLALVQRSNANRSAKVASENETVALAQSLGSQAIVEPRIDLAMLLARAAVHLDHSTRTQGTLLSTLQRSPRVLRAFQLDRFNPGAVSLSPDEETLAFVDSGGRVHVVDARDGTQVGSVIERGVIPAFAYLPDGRLAIANVDDPFEPEFFIWYSIELVDPASGERVGNLRVPKSLIDQQAHGADPHFAVSGNGRRLATPLYILDKDRTVILQWDLRTQRLAAAPIRSDGVFNHVFYSHDGRRIFVVGETTRILDSDTGRVLRTFDFAINHGAVSPDGRYFVSMDPEGSVWFLDTKTGNSGVGVGFHGGAGLGAEFTGPSTVAIGSGDGKILLWDAAARTVVRTLEGHAGPVNSLAPSDDGDTLFSTSQDGVVLQWDLSGERGFGVPLHWGRGFGDVNTISTNMSLDPAGSLAAFGSDDGTVAVWDIAEPRKVGEFKASEGEIVSTAWSPDGKQLAVVGTADESSLQLWSVDRSRMTFERRLEGIDAYSAVAFAGDGRTVFAAGNDAGADPFVSGKVAAWDVTGGDLVAPPASLPSAPHHLSVAPDGRTLGFCFFDGTAGVAQLEDASDMTTFRASDNFLCAQSSFSPDGRVLATAGYDGFLGLWNAATSEPLRERVDASDRGLTGVGWDPSGERLVTAGTDGTVRMYDSTTWQQIGDSLAFDGGWPRVAFTPDGSTIIATGHAGSATLWPATEQAWGDHACEVANRDLTKTEWELYVPGRPYERICSEAG